MALLQALLALISKSAGKILNALFGWAVRALFGQTTAREQTFLSVVVAAAVAWPVLLVGIAAPKIAALLLAFVPIPHAVPSWTVRIVWMTLALVIPFAVGIAVATKAPPSDRRESRVLSVLRGFPITVGLAAAFVVMFVSVPVMRLGRDPAPPKERRHPAGHQRVGVPPGRGYHLRCPEPTRVYAAPGRSWVVGGGANPDPDLAGR